VATEDGPLFPFAVPIAGELLVTPRWRRWLLLVWQALSNAQRSIPIAPQLDQNASLPTTSMDGGTLSAGLYAVSWYLRRTVDDGVSSSAQVAIGWVDGTTQTYTAPAITEAGSALQVNEVITIYSAAASPITYTVTYASNTPGGMHYDFRPVLQSITSNES
jgi:hypothetical protein